MDNRAGVRNRQLWLAVLVMCTLGWLQISCDDDDDGDDDLPSTGEIKPEGDNPDWAPDIDGDMLATIEQFEKFNIPPLPTLRVDQARKSPTMKDAAEAVIEKFRLRPDKPDVQISNQVIPGPTPEGILIRIYTPMDNQSDYPVIVYYHGGGWVIANPEVYEPSAAALAEKAGAIVVSVAYRQAPENKFPAAHEDAYAAYQWVRMNAQTINGDTARVAVAGESAGGNLAGAVCLMAKERGLKLPDHQLLVYPIAGYNFDTPSYQQYANAKPLNKELMQWFFMNYLNSPDEGMSPWISLVNADVTGLPPATIITAQIDPLMSEGEQYAQKLEDAGIDVSYQNYEGVTHEFFGLASVVQDAQEAQDMAVARLREAFENSLASN